MKNTSRQDGSRSGAISRRKFMRTAGALAAGFTIVPRHVLGGAGYVPPSDKVNIAFIGVGSQGLRVMLEFLKEPDVQAVAVCDPNLSSADYPQWGESEFRDSVRELLGVSTGWDWLSPNQPIQLTHSMQTTSGVAGREPCQKIVNAYYGSKKRSGEYKGCSAYSDFRELLEKEKDFDAVVVGTTDNLHAVASAAAMRKGKHVFCQKPMTHTIYEARRIAEIARETGVATQVAVGNQASEATRQLCEWVWSHRPRARVGELVEPALLGAGGGAPERYGSGARRFGLEPLARPGAGAPLQPRLPSLCLARLVRLRLRRPG